MKTNDVTNEQLAEGLKFLAEKAIKLEAIDRWVHVIDEAARRLTEKPDKRMFEVRYRTKYFPNATWEFIPSYRVRGYSPKDAAERFIDSRFLNSVSELRVNEVGGGQPEFFDQGQLS